MDGKSVSNRGLAIVGILAASVAVSLFAATTTPTAPPTFCVNKKCATTAPPSPPTSGPIKWHPGHYVWVSGPGWGSQVQSGTFNLLDSTATDSNVGGIQVILYWYNLEGDVAGDYSAGFALVDSILAKLASLRTPKRLMLVVQERTFGTGSGTIPGGIYPLYLANTPNAVAVAPAGVQWSGSLTSIARLDNSAVMDHLVALSQAYGARYNSNPLFEMYAPMSELAVSSNAGINPGNYVAQLERLYTASAAAWPNTLLRWQLNYAPADPNDQTMLSILAVAKSMPQSAIGGPDPELPLPLASDYPAGVRTIQGNRVFRGVSQSGTTIAQTYADLRTKMPWVGEYQGSSSIGAGAVLPADFGSYEINVMAASHVVYIYNSWLPSGSSSSDPHRWAAQLAYIDSTGGATNTAVTPPGH